MIVLIMELAESPGNDTVSAMALLSLSIDRGSRHVGNFQQHGTDQMARLQQIHVDVLMVRHLTTLLGLFLLRRLVVEAARTDSLRQ